MENQYSIDNKYQVYTIPLANGLNNFEIDTMLNNNFLTTFFVDDNGESVNVGKVYISFTSSNNYGLTFLNGSKYKSNFQKIYLNAPAQAGINLRVFVGLDCFYEKETPVTNAILTQPIATALGSVDYDIFCNGAVNNGLTPVTISNSLNGHSVKGLNSILLSNVDSVEPLYFGKDFTALNYSAKALKIDCGEKFEINFNPLANAPYSFLLYSANNCNYQLTVSFTY